MSSDGGPGVGAGEVDVVGAVVDGGTTVSGVDVVDSVDVVDVVDVASSSALPQADVTSRTATTDVVTHRRVRGHRARFTFKGRMWPSLAEGTLS